MLCSKYLKALCPPIIYNLLRKLIPYKYGFFGNYASWAEAKKVTTGYDNQAIFDRVKAAALKVKKGYVPYERDSVIFSDIQYSWPVLAGLMRCAALSGRKISVLDFGGSLGSSYFQNRKFFSGLDVEWSIVEQEHFVNFGKKNIADSCLKFYATTAECYEDRNPNVLMFSSVLQYLEKPYELIKQVLTNNIKFIAIDRTPFSKSGEEFIQIQKVPPSIYTASYPLWVFSENKLIQFLIKRGFTCKETFHSSADADTTKFESRGIIMERIQEH